MLAPFPIIPSQIIHTLFDIISLNVDAVLYHDQTQEMWMAVSCFTKLQTIIWRFVCDLVFKMLVASLALSWLDKIDWLTALRHISTERLLVPRNVTKLDMIKIRRWIQLCMKKRWLASLMTHQYKKLPVTMKCGCSLTSCPGHHSAWMQFNVMPRTRLDKNNVTLTYQHQRLQCVSSSLVKTNCKLISS